MSDNRSNPNALLGTNKMAQELADAALLNGASRLIFTSEQYGSAKAAHDAAYRVQLAYGRVRSITRKWALDAALRTWIEIEGERPPLDLELRTPYDTLLSDIVVVPEGVALQMKKFALKELNIQVRQEDGTWA